MGDPVSLSAGPRLDEREDLLCVLLMVWMREADPDGFPVAFHAPLRTAVAEDIEDRGEEWVLLILLLLANVPEKSELAVSS